MFIDNYYSADSDGVRFSRQQASDFAKDVAGDFNPIHDPDAKRFCVPGDLLFAMLLARAGISQRMHISFSGMVVDGISLGISDPAAELITLSDSSGKQYLTVERGGDTSRDEGLISGLVRNYVEFSGQTFPHILVPLLAAQQVMINPDRPLVIYESMAIDLSSLDISAPTLELTAPLLELNGKRGKVSLEFDMKAGGATVGTGRKTLLISGLLPYDEQATARLVDDYTGRKEQFQVTL